MDDCASLDGAGDVPSLVICDNACDQKPLREWRKWSSGLMLFPRSGTRQQKYARVVLILPAPSLLSLWADIQKVPLTYRSGSPEAPRLTHSSLHSFLRKCESLSGGRALCQARSSPVPGDSCTCRAMCILSQLCVVLGMLLKCPIYQSEEKSQLKPNNIGSKIQAVNLICIAAVVPL